MMTLCWWTKLIPGCVWDNAGHTGINGVVRVEQKTLVQTYRTVHTKGVIKGSVDWIHFQLPENENTTGHTPRWLLCYIKMPSADSDIVKSQQKTTFILSEMLTCLCDRIVSAIQMQFSINKTRHSVSYMCSLLARKRRKSCIKSPSNRS